MMTRKPAASAAFSAAMLRGVTRSSEWRRVPSKSTASALYFIGIACRSSRSEPRLLVESPCHSVGLHLRLKLRNIVGENQQIVFAPVAILDVIAQQRFRPETHPLE